MEQLPITAKDEILSRIRNALSDVPANEKPEDLVVERNYRQHTSEPQQEIVQLFVSRIEDYNTGVHRVQESEISRIVADLIKKYQLDQLILPADIPSTWLPAHIQTLRDELGQLTHKQISENNSALLTACIVAIAQTGTIILDGGALQGRRVLSLLPDYAFCVVREDQIVGLVPEAITYLGAVVTQHHRPVTFISGPSATSDIELSRVVGVHGPRHLDILLVARYQQLRIKTYDCNAILHKTRKRL